MLTRKYIERVARLMQQTPEPHGIECLERRETMNEVENDECCDEGKAEYTLSDEVWLTAVQLFQVAMFTQRDVSDMFQAIRVNVVGDQVVLTDESRRQIEEQIQALADAAPVPMPVEQPPVLDDDAPVFVIGKVD